MSSRGGLSALRRPWRRPVRFAAFVAGSVVAVGMVSMRHPASSMAAVQGGADEGREAAYLIESLRSASAQVAALEQQVEKAGLVPGFGEKAEQILSGLEPGAEQAVDGLLHVLFLRQVAQLRQQVAARFEGAGTELGSLRQADQEFVSEAEGLRRPGGSWSFEPERVALRTWLEGAFRREAALVEEKARAARAQQATIDVIGKLQDQMELLTQKAQGMRGGGSPWVLSTSYRVPGTPLQVVGKYEQGRANMEINLTPQKDPTGGEANGLGSIGPANFGVSFNLGL